MSEPKRHHYLPEFYLAGFTRERSRSAAFTVFDLDADEFRSQTPQATAVERFRYAVVDETTGHRDMRVEQLLGDIEGDAAPAIRKLENREALTQDEREALAFFCAFLHNRVPAFDRVVSELVDKAHKELNRRRFPSLEVLRDELESWAERTGASMATPAKDLFEDISADNYNVITPRQNIIKLMLDLSIDFAELFLGMDWFVGHTDSHASFVITDAPLLLIRPPDWKKHEAWGLATPGTTKMIPLSQSMALFMVDSGDGLSHFDVSRDVVRQNNGAMTIRCERFVIGRDEPLVRSLVTATRLRFRPHAPTVEVEWLGAN